MFFSKTNNAGSYIWTPHLKTFLSRDTLEGSDHIMSSFQSVVCNVCAQL